MRTGVMGATLKSSKVVAACAGLAASAAAAPTPAATPARMKSRRSRKSDMSELQAKKTKGPKVRRSESPKVRKSEGSKYRSRIAPEDTMLRLLAVAGTLTATLLAA